MFHSVSTFCLSGQTSLVSTSVYLKAAVKFFVLSFLPAKEMVCSFQRIYTWCFCGREMSITYVSLSAAINQCRPSDLH